MDIPGGKAGTLAWVLIAAFLAVGCSVLGASDANEGSEPPSTHANEQGSNGDATSAWVTSSAGEVPSWVVDAANERWDSLTVRSPGLARPEVEFVRASTPLDFADSYIPCMHDSGFTAVTLMIDGGIASGEIDEESLDAFLLADYTCHVRYAINPSYFQPYTEQQLELIYDFYASDLIPCITSAGFAVDDMPSFEVFVERELGGNPWNPVQLAAGSDIDIYTAIHEACDVVPVGLYE